MEIYNNKTTIYSEIKELNKKINIDDIEEVISVSLCLTPADIALLVEKILNENVASYMFNTETITFRESDKNFIITVRGAQ